MTLGSRDAAADADPSGAPLRKLVREFNLESADGVDGQRGSPGGHFT
jgi:hypothetical protein